MATSRTLVARSHDHSFVEEELKNDRMHLSFVPEFGCHWTRLSLSVKGSWLDFLAPVDDVNELGKSPGGRGCFLMAPWSNRIAGACFEFEGKSHKLRSNFRDGTAIHGDARTRPWKVLERDENRFESVFDSREFDDFNYPFQLTLHHVLRLDGATLHASLTVTNVDREPAPVGFGFHPFVRRRLTSQDSDLILVVPAERYYPAADCLPTAPPEPVSGAKDLRGLKPLGNPDLDHCFTSLSADYYRFIYPGTGCEVRFHADPVFGHVVVYAPRDESGNAADFVAVEPVTSANDGFNLFTRGWDGTGVQRLEPGESRGGAWEITVGDI